MQGRACEVRLFVIWNQVAAGLWCVAVGDYVYSPDDVVFIPLHLALNCCFIDLMTDVLLSVEKDVMLILAPLLNPLY